MSCVFCKVNSVSSYGGWCPVSCFYFWRCKIESFNVVEYKYRSRGIYSYSGCVHLFETSLYPNRAYSSISGYHHHLSFYKLSSTIKWNLPYRARQRSSVQVDQLRVKRLHTKEQLYTVRIFCQKLTFQHVYNRSPWTCFKRVYFDAVFVYTWLCYAIDSLLTLLLHDCSTYISSNETSILHICINYLGKHMKREHSFETEKTFNERKWYINYEISYVKMYKVSKYFWPDEKNCVYSVY